MVMVSICCATYNQENFIEDTIKGFFIQKTTFPFEIIIHDDASTDRTADIIKIYAEKHPGLIFPIYQTENQYSKKKGIWANIVFPIARGKYIAICEGDDYWTDPLKLQKQVDILELHHDVVLTYGNARLIDLTNNYYKKNVYLNSFESAFYNPDVAVNLGLPTLTMVFRNIVKFPEWFPYVKSGDYFLRLLLSKHGKFYYHGEIFGVYRKHPEGISRKIDKIEWNLNTIQYLKLFYKDCIESQKPLILKKIAIHYVYVFFLSIVNKKINLSFITFIKLIFSKGFYSKASLGMTRKLLIEVIFLKNSDVLDTF